MTAAYARKVVNQAAECRRQSAIARIAEPLLEDLEPGEHQLSVDQYRAVAEYLFCGEDDSKKLSRALLDSEFTLTGFRFWCDPNREEAERVTLREFCRRFGAAHTTLLRYVDQLNLNFIKVGNRKFYVLEDLGQVWSEIKRRG